MSILIGRFTANCACLSFINPAVLFVVVFLSSTSSNCFLFGLQNRTTVWHLPILMDGRWNRPIVSKSFSLSRSVSLSPSLSLYLWLSCLETHTVRVNCGFYYNYLVVVVVVVSIHRSVHSVISGINQTQHSLGIIIIFHFYYYQTVITSINHWPFSSIKIHYWLWRQGRKMANFHSSSFLAPFFACFARQLRVVSVA